MTVGDWNFIEMGRERSKNPQYMDFETIQYNCVHSSGIMIPKTITVNRPIDEEKFQKYLKELADIMFTYPTFDRIRNPQ